MKAYLFKLLDIERGEGGRVVLLLVMSFFMGVFLATMSVGSQTLFLNAFDEKKELPTILPIALLVSGGFGLVATLIYNFLQNRIPFQLLSTVSLLTILGITALLEFGQNLFEDPRAIFFIGFTQIIPFTFITYLVFWGSFGRLFNLRQAKRLVGIVDLGGMIASFLAFFSIPFVLIRVFDIKTETLYTIGLLSITAFIILFLILSGYLRRTRTFAQEKKLYKKIGVTDFFKSRYILYMSVFVIVSAVAMGFVDYSYLNVTTQFLTADQLVNFISYLEMTVVIFGFLFETLAADRIIHEYGMRIALLINPILIFAFTAIALFLGFFLGYTPQSEFFVVFFIAIVMSKLFINTLRGAVDQPTFKLYLLPIEASTRIDVQTKIEGVVTAFASLLAGALIIVITRFNLSLIFVTIFTLPLLAVWYFVTNRMHGSYRNALQDTLLNNKGNRMNEKEFTVNKVLEKEINSTAEDKVIYGLKLMEKLEPALFESTVLRLTDSNSKKVKAFADEKVQSLGIDRSSLTNDIKILAQRALGEAEDSDQLSIEPEKLLKLSKSVKQGDRMLAAKLLRKQINTKTIFILLELLRDVDPKVRYEALITARRVRRPETWSLLIELLGSPSYGHHAAAALKEAGEAALPVLEASFHKSGQSDLVMLRIVQVIGRIGGKYAMQLLWRKADYPDKRIVKQILYTFRYTKYTATRREAREVMGLLENEISKTIWNIAAMHELPKTEQFRFLQEALAEEVAENYDQINILLSLLYDPHSVQLVRENLESGDPDNLAFAMELLDLFIDQELKPKLFPLLDDTPAEEKLKILQHYYPRESYTPIQVINYILNRDFNLSNRWTKVCAIHVTAFMDDFHISRGLVAQVFNSDKLLQETAAWVIYNKDKKVYTSIAERLPQRDKKFLDSSIENNQLLDGLNDGFFLWIEMVMFIKQLPIFRNIHGSLVSDLADKITPVDLPAGENVKFNPEDHNAPIIIVAHGEVDLLYDNSVVKNMKAGSLYGDLFQDGPAEKANLIRAKERSILFKIDLMDFYFVMANHHELVQGLIQNIGSLKQNSSATVNQNHDGI